MVFLFLLTFFRQVSFLFVTFFLHVFFLPFYHLFILVLSSSYCITLSFFLFFILSFFLSFFSALLSFNLFLPLIPSSTFCSSPHCPIPNFYLTVQKSYLLDDVTYERKRTPCFLQDRLISILAISAII